jgi:hypothetical protein
MYKNIKTAARRDELMRDLVSFLPDSQLEGSAIDVFPSIGGFWGKADS